MTRLLVDIDQLPVDLQAEVASVARPICAEDARHLAYLLDSEDDAERQVRMEQVASQAEYHERLRRRVINAPVPVWWIKEDPQRLADVVREMVVYTTDLNVPAEGATHIADMAHLDEEVADKIVTKTLSTSPKKVSHVG